MYVCMYVCKVLAFTAIIEKALELQLPSQAKTA